jgi:signal transduction histidine kinase
MTRRITVEDNGIGISPEFLPRLFEPFAQEMRPEAANIQGTGLGLSIVKKIVDLMGGTIEVRSAK